MFYFTFYIQQIAEATTIDQLDYITEKACYDETLTANEYCEIYETALNKAKEWGRG